MEIQIINSLDLLKRIHVNIRNNAKINGEFKSNYLFQVVELLHTKIISLVESIIILNRNYKYAESQMILRNIFETGVFILYLQQYPFESERWLNWNNLSFDEKSKIPKKFDDYKKYVSDNGYNQTANIMTKENYRDLRKFAPTFIRNTAFRDNSNYDGKDFNEFYNHICKFAHPSFVSMAKNDRLDQQIKEDIEKSTLFILFESSTIFVDILEKFISQENKFLFENAYLKCRETLGRDS